MDKHAFWFVIRSICCFISFVLILIEMPHPLIPFLHPSLTPTLPAFSSSHMLSTNLPIVKRTVYIENLQICWSTHPPPPFCLLRHLLPLCSCFKTHGAATGSQHIFSSFSMQDVELYTVILNPPNTILTLDWTMHLHNAGIETLPSSLKYNALYVLVSLCF